jgi:ABC-type branched-subunit amino acid transport system substrate-binding protein
MCGRQTLKAMNRGSGNPRTPRQGIALAMVFVALLVSACAAGSLGGSRWAGTSSDPNNPNAAPDQQQRRPPGVQKPSVRIAMLLPLSARGQTAPLAKGLKQAAEMALFEQNNPNVQLSFKDTKGTPEGATAAATAAAADGAEIILGPLFARNVSAVSTVARQVRLPVIAFSNDRRTAGNGTYLLSFLAREEIRRIVTFAAGHGKRRFAALIPDNDYGKLVEPAFRAAVTGAGGYVIALERYPPGTNGMLEPSQRLFKLVKAAADAGDPVDAIFLPGGPDTLPNLAPLVKYASVDPTQVKFLGSGGWDYPNIGRDRAFIGGWFPAPDPQGWRSFSERFIKTFGASPPRIATLSYDAVTIAVSLASGYPTGQRFTAQNLTRSNGFVGIDGALRFTPAGTAERALAILEVGKFGSQVIDRAVMGSAAAGTAAARLPGFAVTGAVR